MTEQDSLARQIYEYLIKVKTQDILNIYNVLAEKPVKRFASHEVAVKRMMAFIDSSRMTRREFVDTYLESPKDSFTPRQGVEPIAITSVSVTQDLSNPTLAALMVEFQERVGQTTGENEVIAIAGDMVLEIFCRILDEQGVGGDPMLLLDHMEGIFSSMD